MTLMLPLIMIKNRQHGGKAKKGDVIKVAVGIDSRTRFIRDGGMQIKIATVKESDVSGNAKAATLLTESFDQNQISDVAGDSLRAELTLTKIETQAQNNGYTRDGEEIKKNTTKFEPDLVDLDVSVTTMDQAKKRFWSYNQRTLTVDTRAPGVSVLNIPLMVVASQVLTKIRTLMNSSIR